MTAIRGPSRARRPPSRPPRPERGAPVALRVDRGVAWITLARPAARNRLDDATLAALVDACAVAEDADDVAVVVLRAEGPSFCAGLPRRAAWPTAPALDAPGALAALTKPVLAAVQGEAAGWGLALAVACDLRLASTAATFVLPDAAEGRLPGGGALARLARIVGPGRALELALLGGRLSAARGAEWGLVTTVVAPARLDGAVEATARARAARAPVALRFAKEAVVRALDLPLEDGIRLEQDLYVLLQTTTDRAEGVRAFLERRRPRFHGR